MRTRALAGRIERCFSFGLALPLLATLGCSSGDAASDGQGSPAGGGETAGSAGVSAKGGAGGAAGQGAGGKGGQSVGGKGGQATAGSGGQAAGGKGGSSSAGAGGQAGQAAGGKAGQGGQAAGGSSGNQGGGAAGAAGGASVCKTDLECGAGEVCGPGGTCEAGCSDAKPCEGGQACCSGQCFDTKSSLQHCGACGASCTTGANAKSVCMEGACIVTCAAGFSDCDGDPKTGCEATGACACKPGDKASCYSGPAGTENVGACKPGTKTCLPDGLSFGPCQGQVLPKPETCATPEDDDCNGQVNEGGAGCSCKPGEVKDCTLGGQMLNNVDPADPSYEKLSICSKGMQTCKPDGTGFGDCQGAVGPKPENCLTPEDDNCDGQVNEGGPGSVGCVCVPGATADCYDGPPSTQGLGACKGGKKTCNADGEGYGACEGQVLPGNEICDGSLTDENCDGQVNEPGQDPSCVCLPGTMKPCYDGPPGTQGVGVCQGGQQACKPDGLGFGACDGQVLPSPETCAAGVDADENCDGQVNEGGAGCVCVPGAVDGCYDGAGGLASPELSAPNGICAAGIRTCNTDGATYGACEGQILPQPELCDGTLTDENCNGQSNESGAGCECSPGATQPCWDGPASAAFGGTSICKKGTQTCSPQGKWGSCQGQVLPGVEPENACTSNIDEDCNGDPFGPGAVDADGDGWTPCAGDCCDTVSGCSSPKLVNPGAYEALGNSVDDDCNPATSDTVAPSACSSVAKFTGVSPTDMAKAMDICQTTTLAAKTPGLISATFLRANGSTPSATELSNMQNWQGAVLQNYGTGGVLPKAGPTMAGMSSGKMRDENDAGFVAPNGGTDFGSSSQPPTAYLAAHGGVLPASAGCSGSCPSGSGANDSINLRLQLRVPTNAQSFSYQFRFFSAEYWTWQCTSYNDFYLTQLISAAKGIPADKNISFDSKNNPVSVNNGFFQVCTTKGCNTCPNGTSPLAGTGMELGSTGGGTLWLQTTSPVVPGEIITLDLMVFDVSDGVLDSLALLDNFQWSLQASSGPVTVPK